MHLRSNWILDNRPRTTQSYTYNAYKAAKNTFRNCNRQATENYLISLNEEIDRSAELDSATFWKLLKMRKNKTTVNDVNFNFNLSTTIFNQPHLSSVLSTATGDHVTCH